MRSPFKFLDPFQQNDAKEFFGRDDEIALLYDSVNKNRLVIVYGTSGTGKTSLVQCGLSSRFDSTDWFPLFVRRGHNINDSLRDALLKMEPASSPSPPIPEILARLNSRYLRPVYLIFDQLEELLILGQEAEQKTFIATVKELLQDTDLDAHIIFILREEFLARLYAFEKEIPTLFDRRLRVEPMSDGKLREVIQRSTRQFNIQLEDPEKNAQQIIASLSAGKSGISLPYLQVYLDMLWREDYQRTYPGADLGELEAALAKKQYPPLEFNTAEISAFGKIEDVLARFLNQQMTLIQKEVLSQAGENRDVVKQVLDCFVTDEGTKQPVRYSSQQEEVHLDPRAPEDLRKLPVPLATRVLRLLEKSRILRFTEESVELAHDSLAALIDQQRSDAQRRLNELHNRLKNNYREYLDNKEFLTRRQLTVLEEYLPLLQPKLDQLVLDFIAASYADAEAREYDELKKAKVQEAKEKQLRENAETALAQLEQTLFVIRERNLETFRMLVDPGIRLIGTLDYAEALQKLGTAAAVEVEAEVKRVALNSLLCELLFFFAEGGRRPELAREAAGHLLRLGQSQGLSGMLDRCIQEEWFTRKQFASLLAALPHYELLKSRYYPVMLDVPVGGDGVFEMGTGPDEWGHRSDETLHKVKLLPYQMAMTPVTFYQFALFSEAAGRRLSSRTPYWGRFGDHPLVNVNWYEAVEYANWLNEQLNLPPCYEIKKERGSDPNNESQLDYLKWKVTWKPDTRGYRLPTEAEWELAARGGVGAPRHIFAGGDDLGELAWYWANSGDEQLSGNWDSNRILENNGRTHPVGNKKANGIGLYDMTGNIYEWCWDWYDYYAECAKEETTNPTGPEKGSHRVYRGGSWDFDVEECRLASRFADHPGYRNHGVGFRLVSAP